MFLIIFLFLPSHLVEANALDLHWQQNIANKIRLPGDNQRYILLNNQSSNKK